MSYRVDHVRFTLECDACGLVEKRDLDAEHESKGIIGWQNVRTDRQGAFCCPACVEAVEAVLNKQARAQQEAQALKEATCEHDYQQRGFLAKCAKCGRWRS